MGLNLGGRSQFNITTAINADINCSLILAVVPPRGQEERISVWGENGYETLTHWESDSKGQELAQRREGLSAMPAI